MMGVSLALASFSFAFVMIVDTPDIPLIHHLDYFEHFAQGSGRGPNSQDMIDYTATGSIMPATPVQNTLSSDIITIDNFKTNEGIYTPLRNSPTLPLDDNAKDAELVDKLPAPLTKPPARLMQRNLLQPNFKRN